MRVKKILGVCWDGVPFIFISTVLSFLATKYWYIPAGIVFWIITVWVVWFFRDPDREPPQDENAIVSPADGTILSIEKVRYPRLLEGEANRVSIFMSVFNVHVNRIPFAGIIRQVHYNPGKYFAAYVEKASLENEQTAVLLDTPKGVPILFIQIAGLIARRIICRVKTGEVVQRGEKYGLIRFGSRCDIYFTNQVEILVKKGDKVEGGKTVLGKMK